jgi:hypothetical protein
VNIHNQGQYFSNRNRSEYFGNLSCDSSELLFLDPDNGFEPEKSCGEKHVTYKEVDDLLCKLKPQGVISVFHHFRRIPFEKDFKRIKERLVGCHATAIYWHSLMFVAVSKSIEAISYVINANRNYSECYPVKMIL